VQIVGVPHHDVIEGAEVDAAIRDRGLAVVDGDELLQEVRRLAVAVDDLGLAAAAKASAGLQCPFLGDRRVEVVFEPPVRDREAAADDSVVG
jgi:hypothetical protein